MTISGIFSVSPEEATVARLAVAVHCAVVCAEAATHNIPSSAAGHSILRSARGRATAPKTICDSILTEQSSHREKMFLAVTLNSP
jgi:hypothetical protein